MTGEQGTLDSSLGGNYMNKASSYGPAIFKIAELVSNESPRDVPFTLINLVNQKKKSLCS